MTARPHRPTPSRRGSRGKGARGPSRQRTLPDRVAALLEDPLDVKLARSIFGTASVPAITSRVKAYCREQFGHGVASCELFTQSVGAVFVLRLDDGERVVLKVHDVDESRWGSAPSFESLTAVYAIQAELARSGFPCAHVLRPPIRGERGAVVAMSYIEGRRADDPHLPAVRRAMAETCAALVRQLFAFRSTPGVPARRLPADRLWPSPHNVLFDLSAPGGEWIDARARAARKILDARPPTFILAHTDVSGANTRVVSGRVVAMYDMDSIALVDEARALASIAVHHTYTPDRGRWVWPSRAQARAFLADYERARGTPFSPPERERLDAGAIYALAYTARAELSLHPAQRDEEGMRARLRQAPDRGYFTDPG